MIVKCKTLQLPGLQIPQISGKKHEPTTPHVTCALLKKKKKFPVDAIELKPLTFQCQSCHRRSSYSVCTADNTKVEAERFSGLWVHSINGHTVSLFNFTIT